jgi:hypothetical protein
LAWRRTSRWAPRGKFLFAASLRLHVRTFVVCLSVSFSVCLSLSAYFCLSLISVLVSVPVPVSVCLCLFTPLFSKHAHNLFLPTDVPLTGQHILRHLDGHGAGDPRARQSLLGSSLMNSFAHWVTARESQKLLKSHQVPPFMAAPRLEAVTTDGVQYSVDHWAWAVLLYEMATVSTPFGAEVCPA